MVFSTALDFFRHKMLADPSGALYWRAACTLIVSDLHFEKGSALARRRNRHLPPYDTRATLSSLSTVLDRYQPQRVISLGDSFHDLDAYGRMDPEDRDMLRHITRGREWIWITGNHDPMRPNSLDGRIEEEIALDGIIFRHQAADNASCEISGHYHPKASILVANNRVSGKCFALDEQRLIMPAFGAYAGGLNVLDPVISRLFRNEFQAAIIGRQRVVCMPRRKLVL